MLRLALEHGKVARVPIVHKPKEAAPRGLLRNRRLPHSARQAAAGLQAAVTLAHTYGWRMQREVLPLELRQLDLAEGTLRLDAGSTKNDDGRVVYLTPELTTMLTAHVARLQALSRELGPVVPYLFPHFPRRHGLKHLVGMQRQDFRKLWRTACRTGYPGMLRHDFRRTAVRNMEQAGVPRSVAMKLTGHRTEAIYRRYAIVSPADLKRAAAQIAASSGTLSGTLAPVTPINQKRTATTTGT